MLSGKIEGGVDQPQARAVKFDGAAHGTSCIHALERFTENLACCTTKVGQFLHAASLRSDEGAHLSKAPVANTTHHDEVLDAAEASVALAMLDDARGEAGADARQLLKLGGRRGVDVYERSAHALPASCLRRHRAIVGRGRESIPPWQFDAGADEQERGEGDDRQKRR